MRKWLVYSTLAFAVFSWALPSASLADEATRSIVKLEFRDHSVTISSSAEGLLYSVRDSSGALLGENLTEQQLSEAHPKLHSQIQSGYASDADGNFIWAGSDESPIEQPEGTGSENK